MAINYPDCPICREELYEESPGGDNWDIGGDPEDSFIVRELTCQNEECPLHEKRQDWFYDFTRIDVEGDEIDIGELKEKFVKSTNEVKEE